VVFRPALGRVSVESVAGAARCLYADPGIGLWRCGVQSLLLCPTPRLMKVRRTTGWGMACCEDLSQRVDGSN